MSKIDLSALLDQIDPSGVDYQEWVNVGMALKYEGYSVSLWSDWSRRDARRFHPGECERKWNSFNGSANPVTGGTIVQMAKERGRVYSAEEGKAFDWDSEIERDELIVIDANWIEAKEIAAPKNWNPAKELITYLETLFEASENVGYVTQSYLNDDGRYIPASKGNYDRNAGHLIKLLSKCNDDIGSVVGDYDANAGAWIRFNPLDGKGVRNENVCEFRYALVESDSVDIEKQNAIIRELELPVACLVHSGNKSLHAIVKINAANQKEYRERVDYLYNVCKKNGFVIDEKNKNPSRLSRMPGVTRGENKQYIIDTNIGKKSWDEWKEWIEAVNDDLPDTENMTDVWNDLPALSPPLIDGILRQEHKMLIAGPSKAGKSYALIELCCSIAEGKKWLGFPCAQGKVMYVNLELDRASCLHRFKDVYTALKWSPDNLKNIDIWNLRGKSVPMDKLAPKLIRRAAKKNYIAIVIDPIYKVITGDENSADQMAHFCNQFDKVCTELGCAVIYCHHHSKGAQGSKRSMDRASGSGVFARDPDALLDLIELEVNDALLTQEKNMAASSVMCRFLDEHGFEEEYSQDDACSRNVMQKLCQSTLDNEEYKELMQRVSEADKRTESRTAWRIEGTLREFPRFPPVNVWFDYPIHKTDHAGVLKDLEAEGDIPAWQKANKKHKESAKNNENNERIKFENALALSNMGKPPTVDTLMEHLNVSDRTVKRYMKKYGYTVDKNNKTVVKIMTES